MINPCPINTIFGQASTFAGNKYLYVRTCGIFTQDFDNQPNQPIVENSSPYYHFNDNKEDKIVYSYGGSYWSYVPDGGWGIFLDNDGKAEYTPGSYGLDLGSPIKFIIIAQ